MDIYIYIFYWVFSSSKKMKKKKICVKNEKKKNCSRIDWATAQLCHNTIGNCFVTQHLWACSRLLSVSQYNYCIVTGAGAGCWENCVAIHQVDCDMSRGLAGKLCCDTKNCIVTGSRLGWLRRVTMHLIVS